MTSPDMGLGHLHQYGSQLRPTSSGSVGRSTSPTEPGGSLRAPYGINGANPTGSLRRNAGSPNYEGKLYSKRAREIQAEEGVGPSLWGPLNSTGATIREREPTIPEVVSPPFNAEAPSSLPELPNPTNFRRARAGTLPSRLPPGGLAASGPQLPVTSRPTPSASPFKTNTASAVAEVDTTPISVPSSSSVASRLRSGSLNLPQRTNYVSPFGPSIFNTPWASTRERNASASSTNGPTSPAQSSFSKDDDHAGPMRTLDYLGLADPPSTRSAIGATRGLDSVLDSQRNAGSLGPLLGDMNLSLNRNLSRIRSYSVNAKEKYEEDEEEEAMVSQVYDAHSGSVTPGSIPTAAALAQAHAQATAHAAAVAAYAGSLTTNRPRARTAGILEAPPTRTLKNYLTTPSRLGDSISASDLHSDRDYFDLGMESVQQQLGGSGVLSGAADGGMLGAGEDGTLEQPTRALWLGNIPASTTTSSLIAIFQAYGAIESARVLTHKNCGFVNFERIESAIQARAVFHGKEIFPGAGPVRIGFAKVPTTPGAGTPGEGGLLSRSPDPFGSGQNSIPNEHGISSPDALDESSDMTTAAAAAAAAAAIAVPELSQLKADMVKIVVDFGATEQEADGIGKNIDGAVTYDAYAEEIPPISEPSHNRVHDAPKLRDIRKRIDNNTCSQAEIEEIAIGMLDEIAELSSDYLGNTVVQKLFEFCSEEVKMKMLGPIAPHLAEIGVHKNGTWAGQKIIDVAKTDAEKRVICEALRPYTVGLFLDQYGNYVLQCCLRFGAPHNDFIFETMLGRMWDIAQGRFGARAMRACLESHHANKNQQRMMAAAIALHSVQLATNANGALLLTWFLDTCTFPNRRTVLAPRLVPHLVHLCTHKVAYLTVLKVINQRTEPEARDTILRALFFSPQDKILEDILSDHSCGSTLIFKVLTTPFFDESLRAEVVQNVKKILVKLKAHPSQGYKRLMDEVGLPTRSASTKEHSREGRSSSTNSPNRRSDRNHHHNRDHGHGHHHNEHRSHSSHHHQSHGSSGSRDRSGNANSNNHHGNKSVGVEAVASAAGHQPYFSGEGAQFRNGAAANQAVDQQAMAMQAFEQLSLYNQPGGIQQQYQAAMINPSAVRPPGFFPGMPSIPANYVGQLPQIDQLRNGQQNMPAGNGIGGQGLNGIGVASPLMGVGVPAAAFNPLITQNMMAGYGYQPVNGIGQVPMYPQQQQQNPNGSPGGGGRRGRR